MPEPSPSVDVRETHFSWVFLTPDRAFKLLKPVEMPFVDHSDRAQRLRSVEREFDLNHAIAPDVYLGVSDVVEAGETVDRMLVMRRLPEGRRLASLLVAGDVDDHLRAVAHSVAALHAGRPPVHDAPMARIDAVRRNWTENFETIAEHLDTVIPGDDHRRAQTLVDRYLDGRSELFDARIADGHVRDVHGDLTAEDIFCLDDGPRIIDCLAFNDRWRIVDVLADIAFLVMDVERLAGTAAAERLAAWYHEYGNEQHPASLAHHYVAYRAHVRAKVACLRVAQGDAASVALARQYHDLALRHLESGRLRVVMIGGGPGTGKSTLARALGDRLGVPVLSSDETRKQLTSTPRDEHRFAALHEGIYDPAVTAAAYAELVREAGLLVDRGVGAVLDATWSSDAHRRSVRTLCAERRVELVEIECVLDPAIARDRISRRLADGERISDATPALVDQLAAHHEPWPEAVVVDTDQHPSDALAAVLDVVEEPADI